MDNFGEISNKHACTVGVTVVEKNGIVELQDVQRPKICSRDTQGEKLLLGQDA